MRSASSALVVDLGPVRASVTDLTCKSRWGNGISMPSRLNAANSLKYSSLAITRGVGVGLGVGVGVEVAGVDTGVGVPDDSSAGVAVGVGVSVGGGVGVSGSGVGLSKAGVTVTAGEPTGEGITVTAVAGVGVGLGSVLAGVGCAVGVAVGVRVAGGTRVGVGVGVSVDSGVGMGVGRGLGVLSTTTVSTEGGRKITMGVATGGCSVGAGRAGGVGVGTSRVGSAASAVAAWVVGDTAAGTSVVRAFQHATLKTPTAPQAVSSKNRRLSTGSPPFPRNRSLFPELNCGANSSGSGTRSDSSDLPIALPHLEESTGGRDFRPESPRTRNVSRDSIPNHSAWYQQ